MAYAPNRSCTADLHRGMVDGSYKFAAPNRGGVVESTFVPVRKDMSGVWHGYHEIPSKVLPDGRSVSTIDYFDVTPQDKENV
jgi:hypothetical protein